MKRKKISALLMAAVMAVMTVGGCGSQEVSEPAAEGTSTETTQETGEKDIVTALLPPVSGTYQDKINSYVEEFNKEDYMLAYLWMVQGMSIDEVMSLKFQEMKEIDIVK